MTLSGKCVWVTGGANGLGRAAVERLLQEGASVVAFDIDGFGLSRLPKSSNLLTLACDLANTTELEKAIEVATSRFQTTHVLINNAGVIHNEPLVNLFTTNRRHSIDSWRNVLEINLTVPFILGTYVAEHMLVNRIKGLIVNISSICARGNAGQTAYSASKAGIEAITRVWAKELGAHGIRTIAIAPGFLGTESTKQAISTKSFQELKQKIPVKRLGEANEVVEVILTAIKSEYMTGVVIPLDGGLVI